MNLTKDASHDGVLIQFAEGALHLSILEMVRARHEEYVRRHALDFWSIEAPGPVMTDYGWLRWQYLQDAFRAGYTHAMLLETDTMIIDLDTDLREATRARPLAMRYGKVPGGEPDHYQTGIIYIRNDAEARAFLAAIMALCPPNTIAEETEVWWLRRYCQQTDANRLLHTPQWASLATRLDARWNCLHDAVGNPEVPNPIVGGWHGIAGEANKKQAMRRVLAAL